MEVCQRRFCLTCLILLWYSDFGYNYQGSPIPTPFIDELASRGVQLKQYYSHAVCTPARASLMTGRYHINTGLTYVLTPGTPAGKLTVFCLLNV